MITEPCRRCSARRVAPHLPDPTTRIRTHRYVGSACSRCGPPEADTLDSLGFIALRTGDHDEAVEHHRLALTQDRDGEAARVRQRLTDLGAPRGGPPSARAR